MKIITKKKLIIACLCLIPVIFISVLLIIDYVTRNDIRVHNKLEAIASVNEEVEYLVRSQKIIKSDIKLLDLRKEGDTWFFDYEYKKSGEKKYISYWIKENGEFNTYIDIPPYYQKLKYQQQLKK